MHLRIDRHSYHLADRWEDLSLKARMHLTRYLTSSREVLSYGYLCYAVPRRLIDRLTIGQLTDIVSEIDLLGDLPDEAVIASFRYRMRRYYFGDKWMGSATAREFVLADEYFTRYQESGDRADMVRLLATVARTQKRRGSKPSRSSGDHRHHLTSRHEVERIARSIHGVDDSLLTAAFLYFYAAKVWISKTYGPYIFNKSEQSTGINFGWHGTYMSIAETGTFGNLDQVYDTSFHQLCMYLVKVQQSQPTPLKK